MYLFRTAMIACVLLLTTIGCTPEQTPDAAASNDAVATAADKVALIDRSVLFGNADRTQGRISPDGKYLSWLAPNAGVMNIWVAPIDDPTKASAITSDTGRGIPLHMWAYTNEHILYIQDQGGNENTHVYAVHFAASNMH